MAQENQRPQLGFDGVCIGVPVASGYPTVPPPHPTSTVPPPHRASTESGSGSEVSQKQNRPECGPMELLAVAVIFIIIFWGAYVSIKYTPPSFKVESVSVSFHKSDDSSHATWNVGFSVKEGRFSTAFDFNDLNVLIRCMSSNWSTPVVGQSSNNQDPKNMTSLNATVDTLLPRSFDHGSTLEFDVMFRVKFVRIQAVCNNLMVGFSPDAMEGVMEGGPRLCDLCDTN